MHEQECAQVNKSMNKYVVIYASLVSCIMLRDG